MVYSPEEVEESAKGMIGDFLITKQTGAEGRICNSVMVTERKYTRKEFYIAFMNERSMNGPCCIARSVKKFACMATSLERNVERHLLIKRGYRKL